MIVWSELFFFQSLIRNNKRWWWLSFRANSLKMHHLHLCFHFTNRHTTKKNRFLLNFSVSLFHTDLLRARHTAIALSSKRVYFSVRIHFQYLNFQSTFVWPFQKQRNYDINSRKSKGKRKKKKKTSLNFLVMTLWLNLVVVWGL